MPTLNEIQEAHNRIKSFIHTTPVLTNSSLNDLLNAELYFKCENFKKLDHSKYEVPLTQFFNYRRKN